MHQEQNKNKKQGKPLTGFTHLHVHSHYSLLDGLPKIPELVSYIKELGMDAVAVTDHGVLYGAIEFYQQAKKRGIKPIIGLEGYVATGSMYEKNPGIDDKRYHITLLARTTEGYKNLVTLSTQAHLEGFYYKPRMDKELLGKHHEGVIALSGCLAGEIPRLIQAGALDKAEKVIYEYQEIFGKEYFFLEVQHHANIPEQKKVNDALYILAEKTGAPVVATQDSHYLRPEDAEAQDVLMGINTGHTIDEGGRLSMKDDDFSLRSSEEMQDLFSDYPEAIENTGKIADMCNVEIELGTTHLPYYEVPQGYNENTYLEKLAILGLPVRFPKLFKEVLEESTAASLLKTHEDSQKHKEVLDRLSYELGVVKKMGFSSYFLIVQDLVNWAKNQGIIVGPGRGSAAGSITSYLLNITNVDPLAYGLIFERFLQEDRNELPDIDLDFADTRRDEVIRYVEEKYGKDRVAQIITFGTMAARAVVRDVGRTLDYPYSYCDTVAKMIPMSYTLSQTLESVAEFKELYEGDPKAKRLIDLGMKLEGVARHASTHACGVVITKESMDALVPRQHPSQDPDLIITQYEMHAIEDLGLLKVDFLGLKNLTIIENALAAIKVRHGIDIDLDALEPDDKKTIQLLQEVNTTGVFQLESDGMKRYLRELKPTHLEDIIAMVALYRPGPMELLPDFLARKQGKKEITYLHPKLEPILKSTYGIAIYQEQVLEIAREIAGFTYGEADVLRKAIGKKIKDLLDQQKEKFIAGALANGVSEAVSKKLFDFVEPFARYGFNRAHSACYGLIAYQTAYLKAHYPAEFMSAVLNADQKHIDRISFIIEECKNMGITVLPPSINESMKGFTVVSPTEIRFGLAAIKNVGSNAVEAIITERKARGEYTDISNLMERVATKDFNKKSMDSLTKSGALDMLGERSTLLANMDALLSYNRDHQKIASSGQESLFANEPSLIKNSLTLAEAPPVPQKDMLTWEKELLGLYVSGHPMEAYKEQLRSYVPISSVVEAGEARSGSVIVAGVVQAAKKIITRTGKPMAFVTLEDMSGKIELLVFPNLYEERGELIEEGRILVVSGKINERDGTPKLLCDTIKEV